MLSGSEIREQVADSAWRQWSQLGAGGWSGGMHLHRSIDLELLIVTTAWIAIDQPRVFATGAAWLHLYNDFVARPRLKHLLPGEGPELRDSVQRLLTTTAPTLRSPRAKPARTNVQLPPLTGRSDLSMLRSRAVIGVGARAELLRILAHDDARPSSTARLAGYTGYSKRNVADSLAMLEHAGTVMRQRVGNLDEWTLVDRSTISQLLGPFPKSAPTPAHQFRILRTLERQADVFEAHPGDAALTDALAHVAKLAPDLGDLGLRPPTLPALGDHAATYDDWARATLGQLT